jgi:hypothetical protein
MFSWVSTIVDWLGNIVSYLGNIVTALFQLALKLPGYVQDGCVLILNQLFAALSILVAGLYAILPGMSDAPSLGSPMYLQWANWFYPIGAVAAIVTTAVTLYFAYLAIKYALMFVRAV